MSGISKALVGVSLNCQWPGFASTAAKAKPWSVRCPALVKAIGAVDVLLLQECGKDEAAVLFDRLGDDFAYQRYGPLNAVGWRKSKLHYQSTLNVSMNDFGQWPGRGAVVVKLKDEAGNRLRLGSTHLAVKTSNPPISTLKAISARADQIKAFCSTVNDDEDDWPMVVGMDANSKRTDLAPNSPRRVLSKYGWDFPTWNGIDLVAANFGAVIKDLGSFGLGIGSDHDARRVAITTTKK